MGGDDGDLRPARLDQFGNAPLMGRIGIGMEEGNGDRLDAVRLEISQDGIKIGFHERRQHLSLIRHPLPYLAPQVARHQRLGLAVVDIEKVGGVAAADLQHVAKPGGGDKAGLDPLALGQRIDDYRRAMSEKVDIAALKARPLKSVDDPALEIGRRGVGLDDAYPSIL